MAAEPVQIQGSEYEGKIRTPIITVALTIVTLGIYGIVWYYKVNKEMAEMGQAKGTEECGTSPGTSVLALIPGALIIVPPFVSYWNATKRLAKANEITGGGDTIEPPLLFLLMILIGPVGVYLFQRDINKALAAQAGGGAAIPAATPAATPEAPAAPEAAPAAPAAPEAPAAPPADPPSSPQSPA
jgi:hypothetical protein